MTDTNQIDEDKPLDPEVEEIRRRMVRLLVISIGIMVVGLMAVFGAIFYKINQPGEPQAAAKADAALKNLQIRLPEGARHVASDLDGERVLLTIELTNGSRQLLVYDLANSKITGRYTLGN